MKKIKPYLIENVKLIVMENDELKNISPNLDKIKKENHFKVPDNYFDNLPGILQEKIQEPEKQSFFNRIFLVLKPQLKLAGGFVVLMLIAYFAITLITNNNIKSDEITEAITEDEFFIYEDIDSEDIITVLYEDTTVTDSIATDDIIEYLIDEDIDYLAYLDEF